LTRFDAPCRGAENPQAGSVMVNRSTDFTMVIVYCVGPERGGPVCRA
jgi:hypothetical protein